MQSYLQYRAIGRRIRTQWEDNRKAQSKPKHLYNSNPRDTSINDALSSDSTTEVDDGGVPSPPQNADLEKAETLRAISSTGLEKTDTVLASSVTGIEINVTGKGKIFIVHFEGAQDPLNPRAWATSKRIWCTANVGMIALAVGIAASIDSAAIPQGAAAFGVSQLVEAMATGLVGRLSHPVCKTDTHLMHSSLWALDWDP
jgi:hypothetical protein